MKPILFERIQSKIHNLKDNLNPDSIQSLLLLIREQLPQNTLLRDFADFAAHPSSRDRGITFSNVSNTFQNLVKAFKYGGQLSMPQEQSTLLNLGHDLYVFLEQLEFNVSDLRELEVTIGVNMISICDNTELLLNIEDIDRITLNLAEDKRFSNHKFLSATIYFKPTFNGVIKTKPNVGITFCLFAEPL